MSTFSGGEEIVGLFQAVNFATTILNYTVPTGQYLKVDSINDEGGSQQQKTVGYPGGFNKSLSFGGGNTWAVLLRNLSGLVSTTDIVLHEGTTLVTNGNFSAQREYINGRLFNNP